VEQDGNFEICDGLPRKVVTLADPEILVDPKQRTGKVYSEQQLYGLSPGIEAFVKLLQFSIKLFQIATSLCEAQYCARICTLSIEISRTSALT
jgi:hypothetical protein